jgi:hypothetical protein
MTTLRIIDMDVHVPDGVRLATDSPQECRIVHTLDGTSVYNMRVALEGEAVTRGYELRRTDRASYLQRGERRVEIYQISPTRLGIRVDDAEALPFSRVSARGISLAGLALPLPEGARVKPGRERHDPGSESWSAEWYVYDVNAAEVASLVHDTLIQGGLKSGGVWPPPKGGIQRWKVEAYSPQQLVQMGITDEGDHLNLHLVVIKGEDAPGRTPSG